MDIEARIARLERENRRLKLVAVATLASVGLVFVLGAANLNQGPQDLTVRSLTVVNNDGNKRAELKTDGDGSGSVNLIDKDGKSFASFYINSQGGVFNLEGKKAGLTMHFTQGTSNMLFLGQDSDVRVKLNTLDAGGIVFKKNEGVSFLPVGK